MPGCGASGCMTGGDTAPKPAQAPINVMTAAQSAGGSNGPVLMEDQLQSLISQYGLDGAASDALRRVPVHVAWEVVKALDSHVRNPSAFVISKLKGMQREGKLPLAQVGKGAGVKAGGEPPSLEALTSISLEDGKWGDGKGGSLVAPPGGGYGPWKGGKPAPAGTVMAPMMGGAIADGAGPCGAPAPCGTSGRSGGSMPPQVVRPPLPHGCGGCGGCEGCGGCGPCGTACGGCGGCGGGSGYDRPPKFQRFSNIMDAVLLLGLDKSCENALKNFPTSAAMAICNNVDANVRNPSAWVWNALRQVAAERGLPAPQVVDEGDARGAKRRRLGVVDWNCDRFWSAWNMRTWLDALSVESEEVLEHHPLLSQKFQTLSQIVDQFVFRDQQGKFEIDDSFYEANGIGKIDHINIMSIWFTKHLNE